MLASWHQKDDTKKLEKYRVELIRIVLDKF